MAPGGRGARGRPGYARSFPGRPESRKIRGRSKVRRLDQNRATRCCRPLALAGGAEQRGTKSVAVAEETGARGTGLAERANERADQVSRSSREIGWRKSRRD